MSIESLWPRFFMIMVCDLVNIVIARNWLLVVSYWFGLAKRQEQASGMFYLICQKNMLLYINARREGIFGKIIFW